MADRGSSRMADCGSSIQSYTEAWVAANTLAKVNQLEESFQAGKSQPVARSSATVTPVMVSGGGGEVVQVATSLGGDMVQLVRKEAPRPQGLLQEAPRPQGILHTMNMNTRMSLVPTTGNDGVKSMPIHCIVEQIQTPPEGCNDGPQILRPEGISPHKPALGNTNGTSPLVEMDTYAILPGTTMFSELVRTALVKIGYTSSESLGAKGAIQIKNWKPLTFDTITDNPNCTLDEILGDLTSVATLRIRLCREVNLRYHKYGVSQNKLDTFRAMNIGVRDEPVQWTDELVRCAVIELLKEINQSKLAKLSPLAQSTISNIANSKYFAKIGPEKCADFGRWYEDYARNKILGNSPPICSESSEGIRLTFHPVYELPKMRSWFNQYHSPSDDLFETLAEELNSDNIRKQRKPVTAKKLKIWWRNEKVRQKRIMGRIERGEEIVKSRKRKKPPTDTPDKPVTPPRPAEGSNEVTVDLPCTCEPSSVDDDSLSALGCPRHNPSRNLSLLDPTQSSGSLNLDLAPPPVSLPQHTSCSRDRAQFQHQSLPVYPMPFVPFQGDPQGIDLSKIPTISTHSQPSPRVHSQFFSSPDRQEEHRQNPLSPRGEPHRYHHQNHSPYSSYNS